MPINFSSENYSKNAVDFYTKLQEEKMEAIYKTPKMSDLEKESERSLKNANFAFQYGTAAEAMFDKDEVNTILTEYDNALDNVFSPFRFDPEEINERIGRDERLITSMLTEINEAGIENIRFEGGDEFIETTKYAIANPGKGPNVINNRLFGWIPDGIGGTIFDLSDSWYAASYENATGAHLAMSNFGQTTESIARLADMTVANNSTKGVMEDLLLMIKQNDPSFEPTFDVDSLLNQAQALELQDKINWDRDGGWLMDNVFTGFKSLTGLLLTGDYDLTDSEPADLINYKDEVWMGSENREGVRDLLVKAIETSTDLPPKVQDYISNNDDFMNLLKNSVNGSAFVAGLEVKKRNNKIAAYQAQTLGTKSLAAHAKTFGHGFTLDPTLGLDIAASVFTLGGSLLFKGVGGTVKGLGSGIPKIQAKLGANTPLLTDLNRLSIQALRREAQFAKLGKFLSSTGEGISMLQKFMPTQILSELVIPATTRLLRRGKEEPLDLINYLKDGDYLPKTIRGRAMYRAIAGSAEGLLWGRIEYQYATAFEDSLNVSMFGQEEADTIAYMRNQSGMMTQSMLMGAVMGGSLGPALGGTFDTFGGGVKGTAELLNKWSEVSPDNWLNKTTAFAEKNFQEKIGKTSWWGVTKSIINAATDNSITADTRLSVNKALPRIDFGEGDETVATNARVLETKLYELASKSNKEGVSNFQKAVDTVLKDIPEGEQLDAVDFGMRVEDALFAQVTNRKKRLGLRVKVFKGSVKNVNSLDQTARRVDLTNDGKPPETTVNNAGEPFRKKATEAAQQKKKLEDQISTEKENVQTLKETLQEQRKQKASRKDIKETKEKIEQKQTEIENLEDQAVEAGVQAAQFAVESQLADSDGVTQNMSAFNKLLKNKLIKDLDQPDLHPIAAMMAFGLDETLVRKMKNGATEEQKAVLDKMLAFNPNLAPLDGNEIAALKAVIEENFLQEISVRDDVDPHILFDALIREGISEEAAFNEAYNFSFEELATDDARRGLAVLTDDEGNSLLTPEQQSTLDAAVEKVEQVRNQINEGDVSSLNFNKTALNSLAEALGIEKPNKIKDKTKLAAKIKEAWDNATQEQRDAYNDIIIDKDFTDDILKSKETQNIEAIIREAVEKEADDLVTREIQKQKDESSEYQATQQEIDEALAPFKEQKRNAETAPDADKVKSQDHNGNSTALLLLGLVEADKVNDVRTHKFIALLSEGQFGRALDMLMLSGADDPQSIKNDKWVMAMEKGIGTSLPVKAMIAAARDGKDPNAAQYLRSELPRAWRERGDGLKINTIEVDEQIKPARDYLAENGTEQQKKHFADLEKKQKSQREAIKNVVERSRQDIIDRKVRLASERVIAETRPAIGFVKPILKALQSVNGHIVRAKTNPKNISGDLQTEYSYDISIPRDALLGVLKANDLLGMMFQIDESSGTLGQKPPVYDAKVVLNILQNKMASVAPALRDTFIPGLQRIYDNMYNNRIDGTGLYKGDGSIRNLLDHMEGVLDSEAEFYTNEFNNNGQRFYSDDGVYNIDSDKWDRDFARELNRIDFGNYFDNLGTSVTPEQKLARVLSDLNQSLDNRKLTSLNELGSTRGALGPKRAAKAVRSALLSDKATTSSVSETSAVVSGGRIEARRILGADRAVGIQKETDSQLIDMFDEYVVQKRQGYFLDDDLTDEDLDVLEEFLGNIRVKDIPNRVRAENSLLPTVVIDSLTKKLPQNIKELIEQNKINMLRSDPAFMATIHDAIFPMLRSSISTDGQHFAWNYKIKGKDGEDIYPFRGLGFGFPIADARPDTINAALAAATEITFNYKNLIDTGFKTWESGAWRSKLDPATREKIPEDMSFGEFFLGDGIKQLSAEEQKAVSEQLFPAVGEFDADASGNNIVVAIVNGIEGAGATRDFLSDLIKQVDEGRLNEFLEDNYKTSYERTKEIVQSDLNSETSQEALLKAVRNGEANPDLPEAIKVAAEIFNYEDADGNPTLDLKAIMKNPSMTQPYGAGVNSMAKAIRENFFETYRDQLINDSNVPITADNFERMSRTVAVLLATGFHESSAKSGLSWVNTNLFGKNTKITNQTLRTTLENFRRVRKDQTGTGTLRGSGDAIKDPSGVRSMVADNNSREAGLQNIVDGVEPVLSDIGSFNRMMQQVMGQAIVLTDNGFTKNNIDSAKGITKLILSMVEDAEGNTELQAAIKNKNYNRAKELWSDITDQEEVNNIKLSALNSFIRQGHQLDGDKFKSLLKSLGLDEFSEEIMDNMSPMGKKAFIQNFYRELAIGPTHNRMYTKVSPTDLLGDKPMRPDETSKFTVSEMRPDGLSRNPDEFDAEIRRLTLLDLAKKAASFVEDEDMPVLPSKGKFDPSTYTSFMGEWKRNSELSTSLREKAKLQLKKIDGLLFDGVNDELKDSIETLQKMLSKIVDSGPEARNDSVKGIMEGITGSELQQQINAMPSALGYLPKTFLSSFDTAPATILRKAQLERQQDVKVMRSLEKQIKDKQVTVQQDPFSQQELAYVNMLGNIDDIKPIKFSSMLPTSVFDTVALNITDSPSLQATRIVVKTELDNFVQTVKDVGGNEALETAARNGKYDVVLLHYFSTVAAQEAMKTRKDIKIASDSFEKQKREFVESLGETDPQKIINAIQNNSELRSAQKQLDLLIDASLLEEENVLRSLTQWGFDAKRNITDLYDLMGESIDTVYPGKTIEESIKNTIVNNDISAGNLLAWLSNDAEFLGQVLVDDPKSKYVDSYGGDMAERSLNALGVFSTGDSAALYLAVYAQNYSKRYAVASLLNVPQDNINSAEIQAFSIWLDAKFNLDQYTMDSIKAEFPELVEALEKPESQTNILNLLRDGKKQAVDAFDNTALLSEMTRNIPLTEAAANDLRTQYPNIEKIISKVSPDMTVERMLLGKSETLFSDKHKALINQFGDVTAPHKIIGDAKIKLMAGEKLNAVNSIGSKNLVDAMRLTSALTLESLPYDQTLAGNIRGHDPFTKFGSSISKTRRKAAILSQAIKSLIKGKPESEFIVDKRNSFISEGKAKQAEFVSYSDAQISNAIDAAEEIVAKGILQDLGLSNVQLDRIFRTEDDITRNKSDIYRAARLVPFLSKEVSEYNIFKRQQVIKNNLKRENPVDDLTAYNDFKDNVAPILNRIKKEIITNHRTKIETDPTVSDSTLDNFSNEHDWFNTTIRSINVVDDNNTPTAGGAPIYDGDSVAVVQANKTTQAEKSTIRNRTDGAKPGKGVNTIDYTFGDSTFSSTSAHARFLQGINPLVQSGVLTYNDKLLLKAVFNDRSNSGLLQSFFDTDQATTFSVNEDNISSSITDPVTFRTRIEVANNLAKQFNKIKKLGAAGVVLEEIGHAIGKRMSNDGIHEFVIRAKSLLKNEDGFDSFIALEKQLFGDENRVDYSNRIEHIRKFIDDDDITTVRSNETFGILFAISTLLGKETRDLVRNNDSAHVFSDLYNMENHYIARLNAFYDLAESSPVSIDDVLHPTNIQDNLKSTVYTVDNEIQNVIDDPSSPPFDNEAMFNRATEIGNIEEQRNGLLDDDISKATLPDGRFDPNLLENDGVLNQAKAISKHLDSLVQDASAGYLIDTPMFTLMSNLSAGKISRQFVEKAMLNLAQPFGARRFAFMANNQDGMSGTNLLLLGMIDTKNLVSTASFNTALPTIQGLQIHLDGIFEPLMRPLIELKAENVSLGKNGQANYNSFVKLFWNVVMNKDGERIQGWTGETKAKKIAIEEMAKLYKETELEFPFDPTTGKITDPQLDGILDSVVGMAKVWSNPENGIWKQILTAQVDNGKFDANFAENAITEGVVPIKIADEAFTRGTAEESLDVREKFRFAFADHLYSAMTDRNNRFVHEDLFTLVFADRLEGDIKAPTRIKDMQLASAKYNEYLTNAATPEEAWSRFTSDIRSGKISKNELLSGEELNLFYEVINQDNITFSKKQLEIMQFIQDKQNAKTPSSGKRAVTNRNMNKLTEFIAEEYVMRAGSSSYTFINDRFLNTSRLLNDPSIAEFINMDPIEIFDSVKRGQAGQAFDRQIFGNALGMRGFGIGDYLQLLTTADERSLKLDDIIVDSNLRGKEKRPLTDTERQKAKKVLKHIKDSYKFAMGTLSYEEVDKDAIGFIGMLTTIADAGTAISVGPRLGLAAVLEETPMALVGELRSSLMHLQGEGFKAIRSFTNSAENQQWIEGMGFITRDLQFEANRALQKLGIDPRQIKQGRAEKIIAATYKTAAFGLDSQTRVNRARGVKKWIMEVNSMFSNLAEEDITYTSRDGTTVSISSKGLKENATFDMVYELVQSMGDLTEYTSTEIKKTLKQLDISDETLDAVIDMMRNGLFSEELAPIFRKLWFDNYATIKSKGIPFEEMMKTISFDYNTSAKERANASQVIMSLREIAFTAGTRYAKQPTLSENASIGSRPLGAFSRLVTTLTNYTSSVFGSLRKASTVSTGLLASAFLAHAISGYMYYKLVQMQNSKSAEDILKDWQRDPMQEITDAFMSVPFFGMNQMVITTLLQVLRGERPSNTQIFNYASLSMINRILQLPRKTMNSIGDMQEGNISRGTANLSSTIPLPAMPIVSMGLRSWDKSIPIVKFTEGVPQETPTKSKPVTEPKVPQMDMEAQKPERKPEEATSREAPPTETTPSIKDELSKASEFTGELKRGLDRRLGYS